MGKTDPSADQIKKYYDEHVQDFDTVTVTHILFSTVDDQRNPLPEDKQQEAKKKADDLFATLKPSDDFKALATKYSQDPGVTENQGQYTFKYAESYAPEFKDWAFKAKVGEIGLVKSDFGYHIMKLDKRTSFSDTDQAAVKSAIQSSDFQNKLEEWKKDAKYNVITKPKEINRIKIV
jgi:foldase protein PrsA